MLQGFIILYKHIFKTASAKDIILALNTIIKEGRESTKANAELVWSFVLKKLNLTYHEKIFSITNNGYKMKINDISKNWTLTMPAEGRNS